MKRWICEFSLVIFYIAFIGVTSVEAYETTFMTHSIEGKVYRDKNGELRGIKNMGRRAFSIELVREMMFQMRQPVKFKEVPLRRAEQKLEEHNMALFNLARTKEREQLYKWVGPLQVDNVYFYKSKRKNIDIQSISDAKLVGTICVLRGSSQFENLKKKGFENLYTHNRWSGCLQMLSAQRVDLVPMSDSLLEAAMTEAQITWDNIQNTFVLLQVNEGYIAFSKDHPDHVIKQWQMTLDNLKESGKYQQLVNEYLNTTENTNSTLSKSID